MSYKIKLDQFEGPLDLLLFFIHRDKVNIYDIPISNITNEFLEYVKMMRVFRIDVGGEFVLMASMLMQLKAKTLLPHSEVDDEGEIIDPRTELVHRLLEYKQFKESSLELQHLRENHAVKYERGQELPYTEQVENIEAIVQDVTLFKLISIFKDVMDNMPEINPYELHQEEVHVEEQILSLREELRLKSTFTFSSLKSKLNSKLKIVVMFIAILELIRNGEIKIEQSSSFGDIKISEVSHG